MRDTPEKMSPADFAQLRIFGEAFGMSPSSRSRIVLEEDKVTSKKVVMR
jgi:hypothetical protein